MSDKTNSTIDLHDKDVREFINRSRDAYIHERDKSLGESNETERALCGQLMLITTILSSANVIVLSNSQLLLSLSPIQRLLISLGVFLLTVSIFAGIKYYFALIRFHDDWARAANEVVNLHSKVEFIDFNEAAQKVDTIFEELDTNAPKTWLHLQIGLIASGFGAYMILLLALLFNFQLITSHLPTFMR